MHLRNPKHYYQAYKDTSCQLQTGRSHRKTTSLEEWDLLDVPQTEDEHMDYGSWPFQKSGCSTAGSLSSSIHDWVGGGCTWLL
jgi:hypothetical protein